MEEVSAEKFREVWDDAGERMMRVAGTGSYARQRDEVRFVIAALCLLLEVPPGPIAEECSLLTMVQVMR